MCQETKTYIIAEAGVNHNGSFLNAKKLIDVAVEAGADCVKFQTFVPEKLVSKYAEKAEYQKRNTKNNDSQLDMLKKLTLNKEEFVKLALYAKQRGIDFCSTAFDEDSIELVHDLNCKFWKIPSGEITNLPYLRQIALYGEPIILSTGMCTLEEIRDAYNILKQNGAEEIVLLHCTTEYPAPIEDVNLNVIKTLKDTFHCAVGYSDHTPGIDVPIAAVAMGAKVIEKHFTLDKNMEGPDHKASLEPKELAEMIKKIRSIERALGNGKKNPSPSERKNIFIARKSIVAKKNIYKGEVFSVENITTKRPGNGISPMRWDKVIGTIANRDYMEDELIEL